MNKPPEDPQIAVIKAAYNEARKALKADYDAVSAEAWTAYQTRALKLRDDYNKALHAIETQGNASQTS